MLDEPTSGLDPVARRAFLKVLVGDVASEGRTVFFCIIAAVVPLLLALWLFRRKAY